MTSDAFRVRGESEIYRSLEIDSSLVINQCRSDYSIINHPLLNKPNSSAKHRNIRTSQHSQDDEQQDVWVSHDHQRRSSFVPARMVDCLAVSCRFHNRGSTKSTLTGNRNPSSVSRFPAKLQPRPPSRNGRIISPTPKPTCRESSYVATRAAIKSTKNVDN